MKNIFLLSALALCLSFVSFAPPVSVGNVKAVDRTVSALVVNVGANGPIRLEILLNKGETYGSVVVTPPTDDPFETTIPLAGANLEPNTKVAYTVKVYDPYDSNTAKTSEEGTVIIK